jgi:hypothetical protein
MNISGVWPRLLWQGQEKVAIVWSLIQGGIFFPKVQVRKDGLKAGLGISLL